MNFDKNFDLEKVQVCTKRFVNGTQLQCNWGDGYLIGPWFGHEADAKDWKAFIEHTINRAVHGVKPDDYDDIVAERDTLSSQVATLSAQIAELTDSESMLKAENQSLRDEVQIFRESGLKGKLSDLYSLIGGMLDDAADQAVEEVNGIESEDDGIRLTKNQELIYGLIPQMTHHDAVSLYNKMMDEYIAADTNNSKSEVLRSYITIPKLAEMSGLSYSVVHYAVCYKKKSLVDLGLVSCIHDESVKNYPFLFYIPVDSNSEVENVEAIEIDSDNKYDTETFNDPLNKARVLKIFGNNYKQASAKMDGSLWGLLHEHDLTYGMLCTSRDQDFMDLFDKPLFDARSYVGSKEKLLRQNVITYLLDEKLAMIKNDVDTYTIEDISDELKVHPAYIWAICIYKGIPFQMDGEEFDFFDMKPHKPLSTGERIDLMGGLKFLKNCKQSGMSQRAIADKYALQQSAVSRYIIAHDECWSEW